MKLRNPGPVESAPILEGPAGELADIIAHWPGVAAYTHWQLGSPGVVDGAEFHVGDPELGHIHLDGTVHILLSSAIASLLVRKGLARTPSWSDAWITHPVRSSADTDHGAWLFRIAYDRRCGVSDFEVLARIEAAAEKPKALATSPHVA